MQKLLFFLNVLAGKFKAKFNLTFFFFYDAIRDITDDEACVDELRQTIRFFAAVLAHRAQRVHKPLYNILTHISQFTYISERHTD